MISDNQIPDNGDRCAFPFACQGETTEPEAYYGLTKREYFAAMSLMGIQSNPGNNERLFTQDAVLAVETADALIAELNKPGTP